LSISSTTFRQTGTRFDFRVEGYWNMTLYIKEKKPISYPNIARFWDLRRLTRDGGIRQAV